VAKRLLKWFGFLLLGSVVIMGAIYGSLAWSPPGARAVDYQVFKQNAARPLVFAHRGGAKIAPENTIFAFTKAVEMGVDAIELDVHGTADGKMVVMHDATVDRTTDGSGAVNTKTLAELKQLNAGYRWSPDGGNTFPFRESKLSIPTLEEVFDAFPQMTFNIEPKQGEPSIIEPLCRTLREHRMTERVIVGSFSQSIIDEFRATCPEVATSASPSEVGKFLTMFKAGLSKNYSPVMQALQVPESAGVQVVSREFIEAAHERNLKVHVWTVNETTDMQRLLEMGVDGIMTDYPDRLLALLKQK
jgi:glycerophosphoryl diester phosphodiesterase